jgi:hypothetical protein
MTIVMKSAVSKLKQNQERVQNANIGAKKTAHTHTNNYEQYHEKREIYSPECRRGRIDRDRHYDLRALPLQRGALLTHELRVQRGGRGRGR